MTIYSDDFQAGTPGNDLSTLPQWSLSPNSPGNCTFHDDGGDIGPRAFGAQDKGEYINSSQLGSTNMTVEMHGLKFWGSNNHECGVIGNWDGTNGFAAMFEQAGTWGCSIKYTTNGGATWSKIGGSITPNPGWVNGDSAGIRITDDGTTTTISLLQNGSVVGSRTYSGVFAGVQAGLILHGSGSASGVYCSSWSASDGLDEITLDAWETGDGHPIQQVGGFCDVEFAGTYGTADYIQLQVVVDGDQPSPTGWSTTAAKNGLYSDTVSIPSAASLSVFPRMLCSLRS
jgi:hypothetical protein